MPSGKQTAETTTQFSNQRQGILDQVFGTPGTSYRGWSGQQGTPGTPGNLQDLSQIFGPLQPPASPLQRQSTDAISNYLNQQAPEQRAFQMAQQSLNPMLTGTGQFGNIATAAQPIFDRNLTEGISQLGAAAPGRFGSAFLQQGTDLAGRATQDFNLFIQQARQQDIMNRLQANQTLGMLGQQAGQGERQGLFGAGQLGLAQSQFGGQGIQNQLQLQQMLMQMLNTPTGQTQTMSGGGGFGDLLGGLLGFGTGALGGPFLGSLGQGLGRSMFQDPSKLWQTGSGTAAGDTGRNT